MNAYLVRRVGVASAVIAASTWTATSLAQGTAVVAQPPTRPAPAETITTGYSGPNRAMLGSGVAVFGLSYVPAVIVASQSPQSVDSKLYIPVAGPWLDLANRPSCGAGAAPCDEEGRNRALVAVDGAFQGLGALLTVGSFLMPEHKQVVTTTVGVDKPEVHFGPARLGSGYGVSAYGSF
jgi:hypothetical protein